MRWAELDHQRRTFEKERQSFTDAAIRLSHEVKNVGRINVKVPEGTLSKNQMRLQ